MPGKNTIISIETDNVTAAHSNQICTVRGKFFMIPPAYNHNHKWFQDAIPATFCVVFSPDYPLPGQSQNILFPIHTGGFVPGQAAVADVGQREATGQIPLRLAQYAPF
jgi:hypothetical protein